MIISERKRKINLIKEIAVTVVRLIVPSPRGTDLDLLCTGRGAM